MTRYIHHQPGQSIYDLCNQAYGTLDLLIKFCRDNNVTDLSNIQEGAMYSYDSTLVRTTGLEYPYASAPVSSELNSTCGVPVGLAATVIGYDSLTFTWGAVPSLSYEYAYNTSGTTPTSGTPTTSTTRVLTGLSEMTTYYFFVRAVCAPGVYSSWVSVQEATTYAPPAPPLDEHLIAKFFADEGVTLSGSDVTVWADLTTENNDLEYTGAGPYPTYVSSGINSLPSVSFAGSDSLATVAGMSGIAGLSAVSVFIVLSVPLPGPSGPAFAMAVDPGTLVAGEFAAGLAPIAGLPDFSLVSKGDVGFNSGTISVTADTPTVLDFVMDFSASLGNEQIVYKNNSSADYVPFATNENTGTFVSSPLSLGGFEGLVSAMLVYDKKLSNSERANVFTYLQTRYGI